MCSPIKAYSIWISRTSRIIFSGNILQFLIYNFVFGHRHVLFSWHAESKLSTLTQTWWDALVRMYGKCCSHLVFTKNHDFHVTLHHDQRHGVNILFVCGNPHMRNHEDHCWFIYNQEHWLTLWHESSSLTGHRSLASTSALGRLQKSTEGKSCVQFLLLLLLLALQQPSAPLLADQNKAQDMEQWRRKYHSVGYIYHLWQGSDWL